MASQSRFIQNIIGDCTIAPTGTVRQGILRRRCSISCFLGRRSYYCRIHIQNYLSTTQLSDFFSAFIGDDTLLIVSLVIGNHRIVIGSAVFNIGIHIGMNQPGFTTQVKSPSLKSLIQIVRSIENFINTIHQVELGNR